MTTSDCARFETMIAKWMLGELSVDEATTLDDHLTRCDACAALAATVPPRGDRPRDQEGLPEVSPAHYRVEREIGRGGMGRVVAARDLRIGRSVAIKELLERRPAHATRFEREARVTARLQHPGIVPIYEIGRWPDGKPFYTMREVEGRTLSETMRRADRLDTRLALLPALIAAADAIAYAHGRRVIHRDLSPANILVGRHGDTVVIDWGLAKDLADADDVDPIAGPYRAAADGVTVAGAVLGTPAYMPPEQARGEPVDERADVYALGAMLYTLLAGGPPYRGDSAERILDDVRAAAPPPIRVPDAPRDLVSIVEKAMAREPGDRYRDAGELADELRRFQTGRLVSAHSYSAGERVGRWVRKHRGAVVVAAIAVAALTAGAVIAVRGVLGERDRARAERAIADTQRAAATAANLSLLEEQGRQEYLAGHPSRAAAWLLEAYRQGNDSLSLRFLLGAAVRDLEMIERTLIGDPDEPGALAYTPDGKLLVVARERTLELWDLARGSHHDVAVDGASSITDLVISPDGARVAVTSAYDGKIRIYGLPDGVGVMALWGHDGTISGIEFTADSAQLASFGDDGTVRVWDVASGAERQQLVLGPATSYGYDGHLVDDDRAVIAWSVETGEGAIWDLATGRARVRFAHETKMIDAALSPAGDRIVACGEKQIVSVFDAATGARLHRLATGGSIAMGCRFTPDGASILLGSDAGAQIWDPVAGTRREVFSDPTSFGGGELTRDGNVVVAMSGDGALVWDLRADLPRARLDIPSVTHVAVSADGAHAAVSGKGRAIVLLDLRRGRIALQAPAGCPHVALHSEDGRIVMCTDTDRSRTLWNAETATRIAHPPIGESMALAPNGQRMAWVANGAIEVLDVARGAIIATIPAPAPVGKLQFTDDARLLIIDAENAPSEVWSPDTGHRFALGAVVRTGASHDDHAVIGCDAARRCAVWDLDDGDALGPLEVVAMDAVPTLLIVDRARRRFVVQQGGWFDSELLLVELGTGTVLRRIPAISAVHDAATGTLITAGALVQRWSIEDGAPRSDGASESALPAPGLPTLLGDGQLVVTMDMSALGVTIRSAADGRPLADMHHGRRPELVISPHSAQWQMLGYTIDPKGWRLVLPTGYAVMDLTPEQRSAEDVTAALGDRVPWRIVDGVLVPLLSAIRGTVRDGGKPVVADVTIVSDTGTRHSARTDARGELVLTGIASGVYDALALSTATSRYVRTTVTIDDDVELRFDLDASGKAANGHLVDASDAPVPDTAKFWGSERDPDAPAEELPCDQRPELRSLDNAVSTALRVENVSGETMYLRWIDFQGATNPRPHDQIAPGAVYDTQTWTSHPFMLEDAAGKCIVILRARPSPSIYTFSGG